jgi:hypothetical protein
MRSIREYNERNLTPGSTRNESLTGPLQDTVDRIFEHMENEECPLAHLVRAVSILLWLVNIMEDNGISLDRQTREEVEDCAVGLTREYLQRGRNAREHLIWALEWASAGIIKGIAPQVPHASIEYFECLEDRAARAYGKRLPDQACPARLACREGDADLAQLARLAGLARLTGLAGLADFAGLRDLTGKLGDANTFVTVPRFGRLARIALDETPKTIY